MGILKVRKNNDKIPVATKKEKAEAPKERFVIGYATGILYYDRKVQIEWAPRVDTTEMSTRNSHNTSLSQPLRKEPLFSVTFSCLPLFCMGFQVLNNKTVWYVALPKPEPFAIFEQYSVPLAI